MSMRVGGTVLSAAILAATLFLMVTIVANAVGGDTDMYYIEAKALLDSVPMTDGHNDLPWKFKEFADDRVFRDTLNLWDNQPVLDTDIPRIRQGSLGAQFWSVYVSCAFQNKDAVRATLEQIDVVYKLQQAYPDVFSVATTAAEVEDNFYNKKKLASLIGIEGGHQIDSSLGALRMFFKLGVRYMTLTHNCNTPWADANTDPVEIDPHNGLTDFGKTVVREMNRLGMLVDLAHVSQKTMSDVLDIAQSPVIFSHSNAYELCPVARNVPDNILKRLPQNGGVVMITWVPGFTVLGGVNATLYDVCDHIDYVKKVAGIDHIGIGGDMDGITSKVEGLEDVTKYPDLFAELIRRKYTEEELKKIAGLNVLRVLKQAEEKAADLQNSGVLPFEDTIYPDSTTLQHECRNGPIGSP